MKNERARPSLDALVARKIIRAYFESPWKRLEDLAEQLEMPVVDVEAVLGDRGLPIRRKRGGELA
jgi:hypothetical protein